MPFTRTAPECIRQAVRATGVLTGDVMRLLCQLVADEVLTLEPEPGVKKLLEMLKAGSARVDDDEHTVVDQDGKKLATITRKTRKNSTRHWWQRA